MKRSITRWTVALATAGVLGLPVTGFARTTQEQAPPQQQQPQQEQPKPQQQPPAQPQPTEPQPTQQPTAAATQPSAEKSVSPQEHLSQAQASANAITATSLPAKNRAALADLKKHLSTLERLGSSPSAAPAEPAKGSAAKPNWGTEVAAIDKIISEMVGSETSTPSTPAPTGTSGTTGSKASSTIDDATKAKLMEVRTHITAYAAGMAGAPSTPKTEAAASPEATAAPAPAAQAAASPTAETPASPAAQTPAPAQNPAPTQPEPNAAAAQQPSPTQAAAQQPAAAAQAQPAGQQPAAPAQPQMDTEAAHRHLVTARDTLSQLTQLPAAAQLSGEARTQVSQLITNFNELIGNPPDWHVSYKKVAANLNTLLGPDNPGAEATAAAQANPAATATPGAVGTTGTATIEIDPSIRAKLVELRRSLNEFQKASGGDAK